MSLPWIAFYPGAYLKNTVDLTVEQHGAYLLLLMECWTKGRIPKQNDAAMARITRVSVRRYRRSFAAMVDRYFNADGTNKRAVEEVKKAEKLHEKRALAGRKGGYKSAHLRRSKRSKSEANGSSRASPQSQARLHQSERKITTTTTVAARDAAAVENNPAVGPATALPTGAPSRPPGTTNGEAKGPPRKEGKEARKSDLPAGTIVGPEVLR